MNINITLIERYFDKIKYPVTVYSSTEIAGLLIFQAGKPEEYGSKIALIDTYDLLEILQINNVIGAGGSIRKISDDKTDRNAEEKIEALIYNLLVDYIYQLLNAARGKVYNKNIIPLPKHKLEFTEN